ncbi:MAG: Gx transporter family protein [Proteobacteria bacterium]|nr:Gx transporter family protein [Pseudomonadota bacterium]
MRKILSPLSMPSLTKRQDKDRSATLTAERFALCLLLVCSLQIIENLLPRIPIFPWLRLGLSYWIILPFLIKFGVVPAVYLLLLRNLMNLIYGGQVFTTFLISCSAGLISLLIFGPLCCSLFKRKIMGLTGVSLILASSFNISQLITVDLLFIQHQDFYFQLAPICLWSMISGGVVAFLVFKSQGPINQLFFDQYKLNVGADHLVQNPMTIKKSALMYLTLGFFVFILFSQQVLSQIIFLTILLMAIRKHHLMRLLYAWPFYLSLAWLHLFRTDGIFIVAEWITQEGRDAFIFYSIRMTNIILCGQWIAQYLPFVIKRYRSNMYILGTGYTLSLLPAIFGISIAMGRELLIKVKQRDFDNLLTPVIERILLEFEGLKKP